MKKTLGNEQLEPLIFAIRGHRVLLDADLARLYGVSTKRFNEALKRNRHRFPDDFAFQLAAAEFQDLRLQVAASPSQPSDSPVNKSNRSQFATGSSRHRNLSYRPWAFTEHGALMAANDTALRDLYRKLLPLLQPPADPPKRRIGFHTDKDQ
jgi:hypothetical protein